jgi:hypothetical protein
MEMVAAEAHPRHVLPRACGWRARRAATREPSQGKGIGPPFVRASDDREEADVVAESGLGRLLIASNQERTRYQSRRPYAIHLFEQTIVFFCYLRQKINACYE